MLENVRIEVFDDTGLIASYGLHTRGLMKAVRLSERCGEGFKIVVGKAEVTPFEIEMILGAIKCNNAATRRLIGSGEDKAFRVLRRLENVNWSFCED